MKRLHVAFTRPVAVSYRAIPALRATEITEAAAEYDEIYAEWAPNEKVAAESAFGACVEGVRSFTAMKHVGLNVATDLVFTASYTGVNAGFVIAVADDQGMHSSQNEQDSRHYAAAAKLPMLEPSDSEECLNYVKLAYKLSEEYDTPVLMRLSTRISHSQSLVELGGVRKFRQNRMSRILQSTSCLRQMPYGVTLRLRRVRFAFWNWQTPNA